MNDELKFFRKMRFDYERRDFLRFLVETHGYNKYLEVGVLGEHLTFEHVPAPFKVGVDPVSGGTHRMTSDEFFAQNKENFDLIFVDACHHHENVFRDVSNALKCLRPGGTIALHDCFPPTEQYERLEVCGTAWRAFSHFRQDTSLDGAVGNFDYGVGVILRRPNSLPIKLPRPFRDLTYPEMIDHKDTWARLMSVEELQTFCSKGEPCDK